MPKKKTKRLSASDQLTKRKLLKDMEDERDTLSSDLTQLEDSLDRLEKQNLEWTRTLRVMRRAKIHILNELARLQKAYEGAL